MINEYKKGDQKKLSTNFSLSEMHCRCHYISCSVTYVDSTLIDYLEKKRGEIGKPIIINDAFRCARHNADVGGKPGSYHLIGKAADISVPGEDMVKLADKFEDADGLGRYPGRHFLHCDVRGYKSRWTS